MIKWVEGNIFNADEQVLVHQVNCQGAFGKGLAHEIRTRYKSAYLDYKVYVRQAKDKSTLLGQVLITPVEENKYVAHIFGQEFYGTQQKQTSYPALKKGLQQLKNKAKIYNKSLAIPYGIGCGLAGGDWDEVYTILQTVFVDYPITIYKYQKENTK